MPRFAANLTMMFPEVPFLDRFAAAAQAGFKAVEFQFPYAFDVHEIKQRIDENQLTPLLHNLPAGDWSVGERGLACLPTRVDEFRAGVAKAIEYARTLGVERLNCLAGIMPVNEDPDLVWRTLTGNLRYAADATAKAGIRLMVEACNRYDIPGFMLNTSAVTIRALDDAGKANLWLQYDIYHMQRSEGELAATIERLLPRIGHIQVADNPGRHQPGTGEINFPFLFRTLDRLGYDGWVAGEYNPEGATASGLDWCR
ncbi:hydroxypyruvate isomerase [Paraburkholderia rhizosphaerae]|uniref:Hydroxypyruvate isomerase n=1 Tax=Paraburkholderia rhizosphaerae TaxID=480658 RepID=A0A4R8LNZ3_9BURK|nr:hydroxypyruvate isomerase [Paraburkholderia rhizosphaerae]TDY45370.1 hydroxypyruvate isomerase [Paraburkholderia rhizosphaerae]